MKQKIPKELEAEKQELIKKMKEIVEGKE